MISPQQSTRNDVRTRTISRTRLKEKVASAHLVGICGSGMRALAELLADLGWQVTGSDLQSPAPAVEAMRRRGLRVHSGHHDDFLAPDVDFLVYSPAVDARNPERQRAVELGIPTLSYSGMLGRLMQNRTGIAIAGTHGKSTTTAMVATILESAGFSPSAVIGAELRGGRSGWAGDGDLFVVESCEYQRSFLDLTPRDAVILGIEPDHFDCFGRFEETQAAFEEFAERIEAGGSLLIHAECDASRCCAERVGVEVATFSDCDPGADWWITDGRQYHDAMRYRVFHGGLFHSEIVLQLPGRHNALNAVAALAVCHRQGVSPSAIHEGLREFPGIRRRFEPVGSWRGVTLIDDYAHHPTAVAATLQAARERFGKRRLWCAFQPHQVSRTQALMRDFASSFSDADKVLIGPTFTARESTSEGESTSRELAERIGDSARHCDSLDRVIATLEDEARPGDVVITMGAGDIDRVHHEFTRRLQRHHTPR